MAKSIENTRYWVCHECNDYFDLPYPVAHCIHCDHHYPKKDGECSNCHNSLQNAPETEPCDKPAKITGGREGGIMN